MNPATLILALFDWRGTLARGAYRRNAAILVFVDVILRRLDLLSPSALIAWTALIWAVGLSFIARRYHDMGRSAAWIVWANLIAAALALIVFQFYPDALDAIPLPDWLRPGGQAEWVIGRLVLPALVGAAVGSLAQSLWLAWGPSYVGANPYARRAPARSSRSRDESIGEESIGDVAAAQEIIDRHLAARKSEPAAETPAPRQKMAPRRDPQIQRVFGRRGL